MDAPSAPLDQLTALIARHWGIRSLRPLQEQAMRAVLDGRDSLVVMPTGGGKSLCYQAPSLVRGDTTVVVSPLIALMKDQVDGLRSCGVPAAQLDSSLSANERQAYEDDVREGAVRLLFVSPERLVTSSLQRLLRQIDVRTFAIDEAHCISHWGHDFRPEYRQLSQLKEWFPQAAIHGYTATATERVRSDIVAQLHLRDPEILIGNFDRPNLTYRVVPRERDHFRQVLDVLARHPNEAGIIYCIRRRDVDDLAGELRGRGIRALPYHAGMGPDDRRSAQDAFAKEEIDVIVATVAFGMGIDRSNIRFVLHTAMPKSVEHYQQEAGRAGRDGLEAECVLLHGAADLMTWKRLIERSAAEAKEQVDPAFVPTALKHLEDMQHYCRTNLCRHKVLVEYFGQPFLSSKCAACDLCLEGVKAERDSLVIAQKILSCVARVQEGFGVQHVVDVLRGSGNAKVLKYQHEKLSTFGLLKNEAESQVRDWVHQLIDRKALWQENRGDYSVLRLNDTSWEVMRGKSTVPLVRSTRLDKVRQSKSAEVSWKGVDEELFAVLRALRRRIAAEQQVPAYVIFGDATLREMARARPATPERMRLISGVGDAKLVKYGERFLECIRDFRSTV